MSLDSPGQYTDCLARDLVLSIPRNLSFMSLDMGVFSTTSWTYSTISGSSSTGSLRQFRDNKSARCRSLPGKYSTLG
ncbi:Putative ion channel POLLUX-like 1 [Frankliniella fusca]|uniref:Ion channel POLLUX-like 1 n=1 Tax=Frankliniella fusca TaxID=407009 RepID=A0AAE1I1D9_9NEOP|nr:Putative ion channel POLLUX-like 1 [Frankliniella fusca]